MQFCDYDSFYNQLSTEEKKIAPKELFYEGDFCLLTASTSVSVVGSRNPSKSGLERTRIITEHLVSQGITVVSGLASGIDTAAHKAAIDFKGKTIAVLGTPLDKCNPISNKPLLDLIKKNHLALSQFPVGSVVNKANFPQRNKTMALVSDATIIIEASENSGTRHQAWEAIRLNRQVLIMENIIKDPSIQWAKDMLKYGADVLTRDNYKILIGNLMQFA